MKRWTKREVKETVKEYAKHIKENWIMTLIKFFLPLGLSGLVMYGMFLTGTDIWMKFSQLGTIYLFTPGGILTGPLLAIQTFKISLMNTILFVIFIDAMTTLFVLWNLDLFRLVPGIGYLIKRAEDKGERMLKEKPGLRKFAFAGLVTFVLIPLYLSGSIIGSLIGKMIGMKEWRVWLAVMTGVCIRMVMFYFLVNGAKFLWFTLS